MPDKSEVIMEHMQDTRKDLADKIEQLEKKVTDTVGSVTELVESVPSTVESVKETIEQTVSDVTNTVQHTIDAVKGSVENTVGAVKDTMAETVHSVQNFFDVPRQVDRHPWLMLGGSVLLGYLSGRLLLPRRRATEGTAAGYAEASSRQAPEPSAAPAYTPAYSASPPSSGTSDWSGASAHDSGRHWEDMHAAEAKPSKPGWFSRLAQSYSGEITKVKGLALGTMLGVARDMITRWVPEALRHDVTDVINNFTSDIGGKVFQEPVLAQQSESPQATADQPAQQGDGDNFGEGQGTSESEASSTRGGTSRKGGRGRR